MGSHSGSRAGGNRNTFSNLNLLPSATNMAICGELGQLPLHLLWRERILSRIDTAQRRFQISSERPFIYPLGCIKQGCGRRIIEKVMICYRDQFIQLWDSELIVDRVREVKQETNYELTDCSSPDSNWRVTSLKSRWQSIA